MQINASAGYNTLKPFNQKKQIKTKQNHTLFQGMADKGIPTAAPITTEKGWGYYSILLDEPQKCKVKKLYVEPGQELSYQKHSQREEHWIITRGNPTILNGDMGRQYKPGDYVFIPKGGMHGIRNNTSEPAEFIEIQRGSYFGEDDIKRFPYPTQA